MTHEDTLREMSVEKYMLGELTGESRDVFEEHLFECQQCALDLSSGVALLNAARIELAQDAPVKMQAREKSPVRFQWLLNPFWLAPALAGCLCLVLYQSVFVLPGMKRQLAQANEASVLNSLVLAGGASRGGGPPQIVAPVNGSFLLSVDIPSLGTYSGYVCILYSPSGALVWRGDVSPEQAKDVVQIKVPAAITQSGENTLLIQGVQEADGSRSKLDTLATYKFVVELRP
jgi:hypothetical protein